MLSCRPLSMVAAFTTGVIKIVICSTCVALYCLPLFRPPDRKWEIFVAIIQKSRLIVDRKVGVLVQNSSASDDHDHHDARL